MNYDEARQREQDERWDYTTHNKHTGTRALGYCRGWQETSKLALIEKYGEHSGTTMYEGQEKRRAYKDRYHTDGHATKEEANACYKEWLLDHDVHSRTMSGQQRKCQECDKWTQMVVEVGHTSMIVLCSDHQDRETIAKHVRVGACMHS